MSAPRLEVDRVSKSFFGVPAVRDVSLQAAAGRVLALIGQNGAGKSTLMNLIGGVLRPDAGEIRVDGASYTPAGPRDASTAGIAFIHQELNLFTNLSVAENIFIEEFPRRRVGPFTLIDRRRVAERSRELLSEIALDVSPDTLVENLAPGERQLVEVAKALHAEARLIIFDEPTTSLTSRETERLFQLIDRLRQKGTAIIFISHILGDVLRIADDIAVLRDGERVAAGPRPDFDIDRMITAMMGRSIDQVYPPHVPHVRPDALLSVRNVTTRGLVRDVSLTLKQGEVLGLFGLMGSGRTELARIIFGVEERDAGDIVVRGTSMHGQDPRDRIRAGLAFVTENRREEGLMMNMSIADNMALAALPGFSATPLQLVEAGRLAAATVAMGESVHLKARSVDQPVKSLSGGNQQKVVIAKWLLSQPGIFLLDEPTRGIDVGARFEIYGLVNALAEAGAGILLISSEIEELLALSDRILVMNNGEIVGEFARSAFDRERIIRAAFREGDATQ